MYLFRRRKGGCTNACLRNLIGIKNSWPLTCVRSVQGRIHGGAKIGQWVPFFKNTSSSDWKATSTNRMQNNDLEACRNKCSYFCFQYEVLFFICFGVVLDLVISIYFRSNSFISNRVKCFIYIILYNVYEKENLQHLLMILQCVVQAPGPLVFMKI